MRRGRPRRHRSLLVAIGVSLAIAGPVAAQASLRLGTTVIPKSETVSLRVDPRRASFYGRASIVLQVPAAVDSFRFNAQGLAIESMKLIGNAGGVSATRRSRAGGLVVVRPARRLKPGTYTLDIAYSAPFDSQGTGIYRVRDGGDAYAYTFLWPKAARRAFPCWDEPAFKIPWQLTLEIPTSMKAVANTPIESQRDVGAWRTVTFDWTPPMPAYLVCFAVGNLEFTPITGMSVPGNVVTVHGAGRLAGEAADLAPRLLDELEKYFDRPYPYPKLDLIAVPGSFQGAMENAGAITFLDAYLLVDPDQTTPQLRLIHAGIIAHEMAHQWFGDLVSIAWWDDLWLSESFADWMGEKVTAEVLGNAYPAARPMRSARQASELDARSTTRAMRQPVSDDASVDQLADVLTYNKGKALLEMLERWYGETEFRAGIREFVRQHEWGNAKGADLWSTLSRVTGRDVTGPMTSFLDQPGIPIVSVESVGPGRVRLSQRRFLTDGKPAGDQVWKIPVTLSYSDRGKVREQRVMLTQPVQECSLAVATTPEWVHPNAGEHGYYRWKVPDTMVPLLIAAKLDVRERIGFMTNAGALLAAGAIDAGAYVELVGRMASDSDPSVVEAAIEAALLLRDPYVTEETSAAYAAWVRQRFGPVLRRLGPRSRARESALTRSLRPRVLGLVGQWGHDPDAIAAARKLIADYEAKPSSVDAADVPRALLVTAASGDAELFEKYRMRFIGAETPPERAMFLAALCAFREPALADRMLDDALRGPVRPAEAARIPFQLIDEPVHRERVRAWIREHYAAYVKRVPSSLEALLSVHLVRACSTERLAADRKLFATRSSNDPGTLEEFDRMADECAACATQRARGLDAARRAFEAAARPQ